MATRVSKMPRLRSRLAPFGLTLLTALLVSGALPARAGEAPVSEPMVPSFVVPPPERRSRSVGAPNDGRLEEGAELPAEGPGWLVKTPGRTFGTDETIAMIRYLAASYVEAFPGTAPLVIGDISAPAGGRISPHRSHRSGRDVDIAFPERGNVARDRFRAGLPASEVDPVRAWFLFETLLKTGRIRYIFADRAVIAVLREQAVADGWPADVLATWFGVGDRAGIVRHVSGHDSHFHVRLECPAGDTECTTI